MFQLNFNFKFITKMARQCISGIYTSMLSAGASEIDAEAFKSAFNIIFNGNIYNVECTVQKFSHAGLLFQEIFHRFIAPGLCFKLLQSAGIKYPPAIKYKSSAISTDVSRNSLFKREAFDMYYQ